MTKRYQGFNSKERLKKRGKEAGLSFKQCALTSGPSVAGGMLRSRMLKLRRVNCAVVAAVAVLSAAI